MEIYLAHLVVFVGIYWILAASLDLALGYGGLFNIGHAAFFGMGAYTAALISLHLQVSFFLSLILGALLSGVAGLLLGLSVSRLHGDYLALATLAFGVMLEGTLRNWPQLTGGSRGLAGIPPVEVWGIMMTDPITYAVLVWITAGVVIYIIHRMIKSQFGRIIQSIRSDEIAAQALGINIREYKVVVLIISAFFAGASGGLYAHYLGSLDPGRFTITESFLVISIVIIGGTTSLKGTLIGTLVVLLLPEVLRLLELSSARLAAMREMLFAILVIIVLILRPQGMIGKKVLRE